MSKNHLRLVEILVFDPFSCFPGIYTTHRDPLKQLVHNNGHRLLLRAPALILVRQRKPLFSLLVSINLQSHTEEGKFVKHFISIFNGKNQLLSEQDEQRTKQGWEMSVSHSCISVSDLDGILHQCKRILYI